MRRLRWMAASVLCACLGCPGFGSSEDPSKQPEGAHARGIFSAPTDAERTQLGHAAADDTNVYLFAAQDNSGRPIQLWRVARATGEASQLWSGTGSSDNSQLDARMAVGQGEVHWVPPVAGPQAQGCVLYTLATGAKTPSTRSFSGTSAQCAPTGIAVSSGQVIVALDPMDSGDTCSFTFGTFSGGGSGSGTQCLRSSQPRQSILAIGGQDAGNGMLASARPIVSRYLPNAILADGDNVYWFEWTTPEAGTANTLTWDGGALLSVSRTGGTPKVLAPIEASLYPMGMADGGSAIYLALATPRPFEDPPMAGCTLRKVDKKSGAATTIASSFERLCFGIAADTTSAWFLAAWVAPDGRFIEGVGKVPSAAGAFPVPVTLDRDSFDGTMLLSSGTDLVVMSSSYAVGVPKSIVP